MYRYADRNGNVFVLQVEAEARLCMELVSPRDGHAQTRELRERHLTPCEYMRLMSAFSLAIDNRICHCELRNARTSTITATQEGQERRYFLASGSAERDELEGLLGEYVGGVAVG